MNKSINKSILTTTSLIGFTAIMGVLLSSVVVRADESVDTLTVTVDSACTMTATGGNNGSFSATISPGTSSEIAGSTLTTVCNDADGYSIYAIGYSGDSYDTATNTKMLGSGSALNNNIPTATSGSNSYWAMKLSAVTGVTPPTILNSFDDYHVIPEDYTQIAKYTSNTVSGTSEGASVKTNYKISTSSSQTAGTYTGKVKYVMVHPNTADAPEVPVSTPSMQDFSCSLLENIGDTTTLVDSRDGEEYLVGKLADGKCWMLDNLRLGSDSPMALTSDDTHIASGTTYTLPASGTDCFDSSTCTAADGTSGDGYTKAAINTDYKNTTTTSYGSGSGKIGTYYNYCAASAGTICAASGGNNDDATYDICPKGWRMPTGNSSGEYRVLYLAYSSNVTNFQNALSTPLSGFFTNGSASYQGSYGYFWSSTRYTGNSMYSFVVYSSGVTPTGNNYRYYGNSMRCLLGS